MKHMPITSAKWPKYTQGPFATDKMKYKVCPNCGRRIAFELDQCPGCRARRDNDWKPLEIKEIYDLHVNVISRGGLFEKGEINILAKNKGMSFKSEKEIRFVNLEKDFFLCSRNDTAFGKTITLVFTDFIINLVDNEEAEKLAVHIYSTVLNSVLERENCFYNTEHLLFPIK